VAARSAAEAGRLGGVRGAAILLLLATAAAADPFLPARTTLQIDDAAYARYIETLALLKEGMARDPAGSLERAVALLEPFDLAAEFEDPVAKALASATEEGPRRAALLSLAGHLLVARAQGSANVWVFVNGAIQQSGIDDETRKLLKAAADMLREAIRLRPKDARAREDLATALETVDEKANAEEVGRLRTEASALRMDGQEPPAKPTEDEAAKLRGEAEQLEQKATDPDHAGALRLRKEALVRDFCAHTIPIDYDPSLYDSIVLLAPEDLVVQDLTRTYRKRDDTIDSVPPNYHPTTPAQRARIVEQLGKDSGSGAGAALLKLLASADERDPVVEAALRSLILGNHEAVRKNLPALLAATVYTAPDGIEDMRSQLRQLRLQLRVFGANSAWSGAEEQFSPLGQTLLVEAAVRLKVTEAAPVLATLLPLEDDIVQPRGIAAAIGQLGGPAQADALLQVASDPEADVYFRREAILALGRVAPDRLGEVPAEPYLELALAAARYRIEPSEAFLGRLLQGLGSEHEADDAARYLLDLGVREAAQEMERFLADKPNHYAAPLVRNARDQLVQVNR